MKINKVRLKDFMEALEKMYIDGADYVDIIGVSDEYQDTIAVEVRDEYFRDTLLTDEFLNQLI